MPLAPIQHPISPIMLSVVGDRYAFACRVGAIVWEGASTSGDTVLVTHITTGATLWKGRTSDTQTYLGVSFGQSGAHCPDGFTLSQISSGQLLVYLVHQ